MTAQTPDGPWFIHQDDGQTNEFDTFQAAVDCLAALRRECIECGRPYKSGNHLQSACETCLSLPNPDWEDHHTYL